MQVRQRSVVALAVLGTVASLGGVLLTVERGEFHPLLLTGMAATAVWIALDEASGDATDCSEKCSWAPETEGSP